MGRSNRLARPDLHPFLDEAAPLGLLPHLQAQLLARHLRRDRDAYPPWFWK